MIDEAELLRIMRELRRETLHVWIERGWLSPVRENGNFRLRDIDVARARLIEEFRRDLALGDDALDVVLPLIDQVHGLRRELRRIAEAVSAEPDEVRRRIVSNLRR